MQVSVSDNAIGAHCDKFLPKPILIDQHKLDRATKAIYSNSNKQENDTVLLDSENIHKRCVCPGTSTPSPNTPSLAVYILKPTSVSSNNDTLLGEIPFCRVKNIKVDMRESEDGYSLTGIEYMRDTEEYGIH